VVVDDVVDEDRVARQHALGVDVVERVVDVGVTVAVVHRHVDEASDRACAVGLEPRVGLAEHLDERLPEDPPIHVGVTVLVAVVAEVEEAA
jgi:hypothetical protein